MRLGFNIIVNSMSARYSFEFSRLACVIETLKGLTLSHSFEKMFKVRNCQTAARHWEAKLQEKSRTGQSSLGAYSN